MLNGVVDLLRDMALLLVKRQMADAALAGIVGYILRGVEEEMYVLGDGDMLWYVPLG